MRLEAEPFAWQSVKGFVHRPHGAVRDAIVLAHGAGSNSQAPLLVVTCRYFAEAGWLALRIDLPFRQQRPSGPPHPSGAAKDREGLRDAVHCVRGLGARCVVLGGHSYGGRQAMMMAAENPAADGLLLLSYPLHPPDKPEQLRTAHFPELRTPCLFVHGERDPFGSIAEMERAMEAIPARRRLIAVAGAGHDLKKIPLGETLQALLQLLS